MKKVSMLRKFVLLALLIMSVALAGCEGDEGDRGPQGIPGEPGSPGAPGAPGEPAISAALVALQQPEITIDSVAVDDSDPANPIMQITFTPSAETLATYQSRGDGILAADPDRTDGRKEWLRISYARLTDTPAHGIGPQWLRIEDHGYDEGDFTDNGDGSITFAKAFDGAAYDASKTTRVLIQLNGIENVTSSLNVTQDFVPNGGAVVSRAIVSEEACDSCHGNLGGAANGISGIHGGTRYLVAACDVCHADRENSPVGEGISTGRELIYMIHAIHSESDLADDPDVIRGRDDWDEVSYPEDIRNCAKCHTDAAEADNYLTPSMLACTGCHITAVFDGTTTFTGLDGVDKTHPAQADNSACTICHPATGAGFGGSVTEVHDTTPTGMDASEFDVTINMTEPANGEFYEAGETPVVTVTLADHATGTPVAGTVYTADQDGKGVAGNLTEGLSTANLFVYGPRNEAVPVLTTGSSTDPISAWNEVNSDTIGNNDGVCDAGVEQDTLGACLPAQGHSLFLANTAGVANLDPQVITDASGYKYQLKDNIGDLEPGTYMVRFEGADYGGLSNTDYVTSSSAVITFQVGTATEEAKVSGDACLDCHGDTIMHLTGSHAHHAPFNTDHCLACHDKSGNHGDYIGNRVHAVHRGSVTGDFNDIDWFHVRFPQEPNNCTVCHTNPDAETPVWRMPSMLVCGGCHGLMPDADPNNPDYYTDLDPSVGDDAEIIAEKKAQIETEVGAAEHMLQNGGDADADALGELATRSCLVCHGEGKIADLFVTHKLITFPPVVEEED